MSTSETTVTIHLSSPCYGGNSKPLRHLIKNMQL